MSKASKLVDDLKAAGYRAYRFGYRGQYEIVVEGQAGGLSANAPKPVSGAVRISKDGEQVGCFVGIGRSADDDLCATGVPAIRALLLGEHPVTKAQVDAAVAAAEAAK